MSSQAFAAFAALSTSLFATAALACTGAECAYAPANPGYAFAPAPAYAQAQPYQSQAYPISSGYPCMSCAAPQPQMQPLYGLSLIHI